MGRWSEAQQTAIDVAPRITGTLSIVGSACIINELLRLRKGGHQKLSVYHRLVFALCAMDFFGSLGFFMSNWLTNPPALGDVGNDTTCSFQGWLLQFNLASPFWNGVCLNYQLRIINEWRESSVAHLEVFMHTVAWGFPLITSFVALGLDYYRGGAIRCGVG